MLSRSASVLRLGVEDKLIFPLPDKILSGAEKSAIAEEMASRRNELVFIPGWLIGSP